MDMLGRVRRMKMRDKLSISEIAKRTGLARNTVRGWLIRRFPASGRAGFTALPWR